MAQYESEDRNSKAGLTAHFSVSPHAVAVPDIDSHVGLMHTLFTPEDRYGFHVEEADGDVCLRVNLRENPQAAEIHRMLVGWQAAANALRKGEITREAYGPVALQLPRRRHRPAAGESSVPETDGRPGCRTSGTRRR